MLKLLFSVFTFTYLLSANILNVPADFSTIQSAINAANTGDTVLVFPGTYVENINFKGKNIVVTSRFYENKQEQFVTSTIINGNNPAHPDSASVVLFINNEDSTAVLQGFTITGGAGTAWPDEHSVGTFIEGGGILTAFSSPTIQNNIFVDNEATTTRNGIASAGGGAIRSGDGNPKILNNIIMNNKGKYGAGIVLNYCGATVRNNVIFGNTGGGGFGGGGIWINGPNVHPKIIENNTITGNISLLNGGGVLVWDNPSGVELKNNIIWGNLAKNDPEIALDNATITVAYSNVKGGWSGEGNIDANPMFADSGLYLMPASPCVDHGDSTSFFDDPHYGINPELATSPAQGTRRNDMGAYGGPGALVNPDIFAPNLFSAVTAIGFGKVQYGSYLSKYFIQNIGARNLSIDSVRVKNNNNNNLTSHYTSLILQSAGGDFLEISWDAMSQEDLADSILIYHNDVSKISPLPIPVFGNSFAIIKPVDMTMYAASGTMDSGKVYSMNFSTGAVTYLGSTGYDAISNIRRNPVSKELLAMTISSSPNFLRLSSENADNLFLSTISAANVKGLAFSYSGTAYIGQFNGTLSTIDITTGIATKVASTGLKLSGLAFNPVNGELWASVRTTSSGKDNIYKISLPQGTSKLVGATGFGISVKDITFDQNGNLYGIMDTTGMNSYLISIDTVNGKGTVIGNTGIKGIETIELQSFFVTSVARQTSSIPKEYSLQQNYPNPFNPSTEIRFQVPVTANVSLKVFDILGKEVANLVNEKKETGSYSVRFDASKLSSGVYFYTLQAGNYVGTKKMMVLK